jgi:hypothetical protein
VKKNNRSVGTGYLFVRPPPPTDNQTARTGSNPSHPLEHPTLLSRWPIYERVLANLTDGSALDGMLIARKGPLLVMADCTLYTASAEPAELDGDVYIERDRVLYLQTAPPKSL